MTNNFEEAALKAEELMDSKHGDAWKIISKSENGEERVEIKPEYLSEFDDYYEKFLNI